MITESKEIMCLLKEDGIKVEEIDNYHQYPIADNERPKLASDRLEYTFSDGFDGRIWYSSEIVEDKRN